MKKRSTTTLVSLAAVFFCLVSCGNQKTETKETPKAPELEIIDLATNQKVDVQRYKGKVLFVNFWASWCPPCKEEMPSMQALLNELADDARFAMITILYRDDPKDAVGYMKASGYAFPVFVDADGLSARKYGVTGVPETFLIDKKGISRKHVIGPADWSSPEAKTFINALLRE